MLKSEVGFRASQNNCRGKAAFYCKFSSELSSEGYFTQNVKISDDTDNLVISTFRRKQQQVFILNNLKSANSLDELPLIDV